MNKLRVISVDDSEYPSWIFDLRFHRFLRNRFFNFTIVSSDFACSDRRQSLPVLADHQGHVSTMTSSDQLGDGLYKLITSHTHRSNSSLADHVGSWKRNFLRRQKVSETASSVYVCDGSAGLLPTVSDSPSTGQLMPSFSNMTTVSEMSGTTSMTADDTTAVGFSEMSADNLVDDHDVKFGGGNTTPEIICDHHHHCGDVITRAEHPETFLRTLIEVVMPFVMAGFGCMFAGIVLDYVTVFIS